MGIYLAMEMKKMDTTILRSILTQQLGASVETVESLSDDDLLLESGLLDSLNTIKFIMCIEKEYRIKINLDKLDSKHFSSLKNVLKLIKKENKSNEIFS